MTLKEKENKAYASLKEKFGYKNVMQSPRLKKVVVSVGVGSQKDKSKLALIAERIGKITGQKIATTVAKKSIASFKMREGEVVGYVVTLRGARMYDFLERFLNISLPRTKDFRGISAKSLDEIGNYTVAVREHTIFPETSNEDIKDVFGFAITVVTSAKNRAEAHAFLTHLGFPFKKDEVLKK